MTRVCFILVELSHTPTLARCRFSFISRPRTKQSGWGRSTKRRRNPGDLSNEAPAGGGGEAKREKNNPPSTYSSYDRGGDGSEGTRSTVPGIRKPSTLGDREEAETGGGGGGVTSSFEGFLETLKANVESSEATELARFALEQAAVAHLEVCIYLCDLCFCDFWGTSWRVHADSPLLR